MSKSTVISKIRDREKYKAKRKKDDLLKILDMPEGRRYLCDLMNRCGAFRAGFAEQATLLFEEGKRAIGIEVFNEIIAVKPEKFIQIVKDYNAEFAVDRKLNEELQQAEKEDIF